MESTYDRLIKAADELRKLTFPAEIARALNISEQTLGNWKRRGIPDNMMLHVSKCIGCNPFWLSENWGNMALNPQALGVDIGLAYLISPEHDLKFKTLTKASRYYVESLINNLYMAEKGPSYAISLENQNDKIPEHSIQKSEAQNEGGNDEGKDISVRGPAVDRHRRVGAKRSKSG